MTKPVVSRAQIQRAIQAALKAGLRVKAIAPDGTVVIDDGSTPEIQSTPKGQWDD